MKRSIFLMTLIILLLAGVGAGAGTGLALAGPFRPGEFFFPFQHFTERTGALFVLGATGRCQYFISMAERRSGDLAALAGTAREGASLAVLDQDLDRVMFALGKVPEADRPALRGELLTLMDHIKTAAGRLTVLPAQSPETVAAFQARLDILRGMVENPALAQAPEPGRHDARSGTPTDLPVSIGAVPATPALVEPQIVVFPPGSQGAQHDFFPLVGRHEILECKACHPAGEFAGTPNFCEACHLEAKPADHFPGDCAICHDPSAWEAVHFDHAGVVECTGCHSRDKPANHYDGQCSACHSTSAWKPAHFDHAVAGATDCISCHSDKKPANHYNGQCSACHSTNAWKPANFNHQAAGATDCISCHSDKKPANHYNGQCSACHSTNAWKPANFNHQAAGATDCVSCHQGDRPANHFPGQCSQCHKTSSWQGATFNHSFPINHKGANGVCSKCHPSGTDTWTCYTCHNRSETEKHHTEKGIDNIATRCIACHPNGQKGD